jgi:hypothetical protein
MLRVKHEAADDSCAPCDEQLPASDRQSDLFTELPGLPLLDAAALLPNSGGIEQRLDG